MNSVKLWESCDGFRGKWSIIISWLSFPFLFLFQSIRLDDYYNSVKLGNIGVCCAIQSCYQLAECFLIPSYLVIARAYLYSIILYLSDSEGKLYSTENLEGRIAMWAIWDTISRSHSREREFRLPLRTCTEKLVLEWQHAFARRYLSFSPVICNSNLFYIPREKNENPICLSCARTFCVFPLLSRDALSFTCLSRVIINFSTGIKFTQP